MPKYNPLVEQRRGKLEKLIEIGVNPYPNRAKKLHNICDVVNKKEDFLEKGESISLAGRVIAHRRHGKMGFVNIEDESGKIQVYISLDGVGQECYEIFKLTDMGDYMEFEGIMFFTKTGEYTLKAEKLRMLSKNLRPIPTVKEKTVDGKIVRYDEFHDIELRYRKRYLDLLLNPLHKEVFKKRAFIISTIRNFLNDKRFLEVETPILQPLYGGANARPFITHHNVLDIDLYLRIATELYLKRLIVGGFERVYEIGKNFRNEGMDRTHNPEFTCLEVYQAYADYHDMMELTENLVKHIAKVVLDKEELIFDQHIIKITQPWRKATMLDLIKEETGKDFSDFDLESIKKFCKSEKIEFEKSDGAGSLIVKIFEEFVENKLIHPTFVLDFPKDVSPLAKEKEDNLLLAERFELFIAGKECANAFTELNNPVEQRRRLEQQAKLREIGDLEANVVDEDFLEALEYGMPPTGGLGIGIDRLIMLLTNNTSIKEVLFFPQMKPEK